MTKIVESKLASLTQDFTRLRQEVSTLEAQLQSKKADLIATSGAIQVLQKVIEESKEVPQ